MSLSFRQIHLDFHTSEKISGIGSGFQKEQFQKVLNAGHVSSVTLFSKCHHGYAYHPTKVHETHPGLTFDLLKEQMEACREIGVLSPVYISAGLDEKEAVRHPEWVSRLEDESTTWVKDFTSEAGYHLLCFNTGYLELLLGQIREVMENYGPTGIFLDISSVHPCYCAKCRRDIIDRGKDFRDLNAVMEQAEIVYGLYGEKVKNLIHSYRADCSIFHNAGHMIRGRRDIAGYNTHLELESLPTGGWGYGHFPMSASYVCNLGMEYIGMTGKFHSSWGEFGGFKHPNALCYETALSLAFGAKCSIGDQLHPNGNMDMDTYQLIGLAYKQVEEKESYCENSALIADVAILGEEAVNCRISHRDVDRYSDTGANRIMLEGKYLYKFIDMDCDFSEFKVIILPDSIRLDEGLRKRLNKYILGGGRLLATGESGLYKEKDKFAIDFGADFLGANDSLPDYIVPKFDFITGHAPHVMYEKGYNIKVTNGKVLALRIDSYFNRDILHFCSHQHTPYGMGEERAAVVAGKQTVYIGWNIFADYGKKGSLHLKEMVIYALDYLLGENKTITTALPDRGITTLMLQEKENRYIQHLLFAHTTVRGGFELQGEYKAIEVIEDIVPLYQIPVTLKVDKKVKNIYTAPQMEPIQFKEEGGGNSIYYVVPEVKCHQMVVIEFD